MSEKSKRAWGTSFRLGIGAIALVAAAMAQGPVWAKAATLTASELNSELEGGYRVASGDKLRITVFDEPTLTGEYQVGVGGGLSVPLIDEVACNGLTPEQIASAISTKLKEGGYVLVPVVSVEILEHRPFYILGEVKTPGEYPYKGNLTFEQAVAIAGGFTPRANHGAIMLKREDWPNERKVKIDGHALKIAPGDTIRVTESFF